MAKRGRTTKQKPKDKNKSFVAKVSKFNGDRLHIEVPKDKRDKYDSGDPVRVEPIE